MCDPMMAFSLVSSLAGGAKAPKAAAPPKPVPPPALPKPKAPVGGYSSTLLTGAGGLKPGSQNTGTVTLLGQ